MPYVLWLFWYYRASSWCTTHFLFNFLTPQSWHPAIFFPVYFYSPGNLPKSIFKVLWTKTWNPHPALTFTWSTSNHLRGSVTDKDSLQAYRLPQLSWMHFYSPFLLQTLHFIAGDHIQEITKKRKITSNLNLSTNNVDKISLNFFLKILSILDLLF